MKKYVIVGAGITGLTLAWYLKRNHFPLVDITIVEKSDRAGGWIRTIEQDGFLFDAGPRSCRTRGAGVDTLQLVEELGLQGEVIAASKEAQKRFLYVDKQLQQLPGSLWSMFISPLTRTRWPTLCKEWLRAKKDLSKRDEDESIADFFSRRFSKEIAELFIDPMVLGIFAGDMHQLSLSACFPQFHRWELEHGSLLKGMFYSGKHQDPFPSPFIQAMQKTPLFSFKQGMQTLISALSLKLQKETLFHSCVKQLKDRSDHVDVILEDGKTLQADRVFLTLPVKPALSLLDASFPSGRFPLSSTPSASVAVVHVGWKKAVLGRSGFGHLIPSKEKQSVLGMVWDSSVFPQQNRCAQETRITVMLGGMQHPEILELSKEKLEHLVLTALRQQLGIKEPPAFILVHLAKEAIPQYVIGHGKRVEDLRERLHQASPRINLLGSSWHGVSVNDCIAKAKALAAECV